MLRIFRLHSVKVYTNIAVSNAISEQFPQIYVPQIDDRISRIVVQIRYQRVLVPRGLTRFRESEPSIWGT